MLKSKLYQKLLVASVVGTMCVSSGAIAFASTVRSTKTVTVKTVTSKVKLVRGTKTTPTTGVTAARAAVGSVIQKRNPVTTILTAQVTAGVITQVESDSISAYITAQEATIKAKLATMTDAEKKAYFEANKITKDSVFTELVTAGLLTQAQATTIEASVPTLPAGGAQPAGKSIGGDKQKGGVSANFLAAQVTAGIITQSISDNITAYYTTKEATAKAAITAEKAKVAAMTVAEKTAYEASQKAAIQVKQAAEKVTRDAEKAKLATMTDTEKTAYLAANKESRPGIFTELVTAGILTQTQADALQAAM